MNSTCSAVSWFAAGMMYDQISAVPVPIRYQRTAVGRAALTLIMVIAILNIRGAFVAKVFSPRRFRSSSGKALDLKDVNIYYRLFHAVAMWRFRSASQCDGIHRASGCGKSTVLPDVNRMHEVSRRPRRGSVLLDGETSTALGWTRSVSANHRMVFQGQTHSPHMSIVTTWWPLKLQGVRSRRRWTRSPTPRSRVHLWTEVKDRWKSPAAGCRAVSSSGCASPCHRRAARRAVDGRAVLRA